MANDMNPQGAPQKKKSPLVLILVGCGVFLLVGSAITMGFLIWGYYKAKHYVEEQTAPGSMKVAELWPDVPRMDGMSASQQVDIPLGLKVVARTIMDTMMRGVNDGKNAGHWDWTGFSVKDKMPTDVEAFYTTTRMSEQGWKTEGGCMPRNASMNTQPTFCSFQKQEGVKTTGLLIIAAQDEEQHATSVFFIRQEIEAPAAR
jgi:hypothetical protein